MTALADIDAADISVAGTPHDRWDEVVRASPHPDAQQSALWPRYWQRLLPVRPIHYSAHRGTECLGVLLVLELPPRVHLVNWPLGRQLLGLARRISPIWMWRSGPLVRHDVPDRIRIRDQVIARALADARAARASVDATLPLLEPAPSGLDTSDVELVERETALVDLSVGEQSLWEAFHRKTRQPVNRAARMGVIVRELAPVEYPAYEAFLNAHRKRLGQPVFRRRHASDLAQTMAKLRSPEGSAVLVAERGGVWLAAVGIWMFAGRAAEFGLCRSTGDEADLVAGDLLKWEALRWALRRGARVFDMTGVSIDGSPKEQRIAHFKLKWGGARTPYWSLGR